MNRLGVELEAVYEDFRRQRAETDQAARQLEAKAGNDEQAITMAAAASTALRVEELQNSFERALLIIINELGQ